jgi:hypothetical protein
MPGSTHYVAVAPADCRKIKDTTMIGHITMLDT